MELLNKKRNNPDKNNSQCDTFLSKLYDILNDETYKNIIEWSEDGKKVIINDVNKLSEIVLPKFYKHRNFSSFVRQLNLYDFHKIKDNSIKRLIFEKKQFNKNCTKEEIIKINRKDKNTKETFNYDENVVDFVKKYEVSIKEQNNIKNEMNNIKKDNSELLKQIQICNTKIEEQNKHLKKIKVLSIALISLYMKTNTGKDKGENKINMLDLIKDFIAFKENKLNVTQKIEYSIEKVTSFNIVVYNTNILDLNNKGVSDDLSIFNKKNDSFYNINKELNISKNNSSFSLYKNFHY